jgi:spore maturation protein B
LNYIVDAIIPLIIAVVVTYGMFKGVKVYECFIQGAREGIEICLKIFPYLLAMIMAVSVFKVSGAMGIFTKITTPFAAIIGLPPEVVPLVVIKPLSGSGALGIFAQTLKDYGPDSYIGIVASIIMGSTETIFYTITVYYGAVGIKKIRHTLWAAIFADLIAIIMAVITAKNIFHF